MASRIMHYAIAHKLTKKVEIKDYNRFAFGALAPDISNHDNGSYDIAHFGRKIESKGIKGIDWIKFYNKYRNEILADDFFLGYYIHLIVDAYWFKHLQDKFIRKYPKDVKSILYTKGYNDMYKYNSILIEKYSLVYNIESISDLKIDEIDVTNANQYLMDFKKDFQCKKDFNMNFEVYPYDDIMLFIENVYELCVSEINALKENQPIMNPEDLFVEIQ